MASTHHSIEAVQDEITAAAAELRGVARLEQDGQRVQVADWIDSQFIGIADRHGLNEATRSALSLFRGA